MGDGGELREELEQMGQYNEEEDGIKGIKRVARRRVFNSQTSASLVVSQHMISMSTLTMIAVKKNNDEALETLPLIMSGKLKTMQCMLIIPDDSLTYLPLVLTQFCSQSPLSTIHSLISGNRCR